MDDTLKRARELLPAIVITVLSMIQALALELFWGRLQESHYLWQGGTDALVGWLQFGMLLLGIVEIWLLYVSMMLRFSWIPSMADTVVPFLVGLLEFAMIDMIGPETIGPWFFVLGLLFATATIATRVMLRKARRDPFNRWFFENIPPFNRGDYARDAIVVALLLGVGVLLWVIDPPTWLVIASLLYGLFNLGLQLSITHRFWLPYKDVQAVEGE